VEYGYGRRIDTSGRGIGARKLTRIIVFF